jgi:hypothetical protein
MRDTLAELQKDGWTIEGTNSNHIRLEHPEVNTFVIAPNTTSNHRAPLDVRAERRKALKISEQARLLASTTSQLPVPPSFDLPRLQEPSSKRRKPRRNDVERTRQAIVASVQDAAPS